MGARRCRRVCPRSRLGHFSENGGSPVPVTHPAAGESHRQPVFLPDGKRFLFASRAKNGDGLYAGSVDGKLQKRVMDNGSNSVLARGRLFFVRDGNLFFVKDDRLMAAEFHDGAVPRFGSAAALPIHIVSDRVFINSYSPYAVTADGRFIST